MTSGELRRRFVSRCQIDVDECAKKPCGKGGECQNTLGSFNCSCSTGYGGELCELRVTAPNELVSTAWNIGPEEAVGIVVFVACILILVLFFVVIRKRACRRSRSSSSDDDEDKRLGGSPGVPHSFLQRPYFDAKLNKNIYSDIPPQVPVRPISYTPSIPSDSRNNLDRNSFEGSAIPEHPEFSTFNPDSVHGHRKTVAVCSVAPNLPPPPPSNSVSDSDSIQKPNWDYDYDSKLTGIARRGAPKQAPEQQTKLFPMFYLMAIMRENRGAAKSGSLSVEIVPANQSADHMFLLASSPSNTHKTLLLKANHET